MTSDDDPRLEDAAPGLGDPDRSDDTDLPALRQGGAGRGGADQVSGPQPAGDADPPGAAAMAATGTVDPGESGPQGGQLGSAGGGYGTGSAVGSSGGTPDGEDVQQQAGPGPQTDWLRSAPGLPDHDVDELGG
jgi:hypothetical protein